MKTSPFKILIVNPSLVIGGAERVVCLLAEALSQLGEYDVEILTPINSNQAAQSLRPPSNVKLTILDHSRIFLSFWSIRRHLIKNRYDLVISNQRHLNIIVSIATFTIRVKGPKKIRLLVLEHEVPNFITRVSISWKDRLLEKIAPLAYRECEAIICPTLNHAAALKKRWTRLQDKIICIPNPVKLHSSVEAIQKSHPISKTAPIILTVSRLVPVKDVSLSIKSFHILQKTMPCKLVIVGDGPDLPSLKKLVSQLSLGNDVTFVGAVADPTPYYQNADVLLHTSYAEAFGNVLIEALAQGTNVVSTNCPFGPAEILEYGKLGSLVNSRDASAIASAIEARLRDPISATTLRQSVERFSIQSIYEMYQVFTERNETAQSNES